MDKETYEAFKLLAVSLAAYEAQERKTRLSPGLIKTRLGNAKKEPKKKRIPSSLR